jgi:hypothetical protein
MATHASLLLSPSPTNKQATLVPLVERRCPPPDRFRLAAAAAGQPHTPRTLRSYMLRGRTGAVASGPSPPPPPPQPHLLALLVIIMASLASARSAFRGATTTATRTSTFGFSRSPTRVCACILMSQPQIGNHPSCVWAGGIASCFLPGSGGKRPLVAAAAPQFQPRASLHASSSARAAAAASHPYADPLFDDVPDRRWVDSIQRQRLPLYLS